MSFSGEGKLIEAVIDGDPDKTVVPVVCDASGHLIVDTSGMSVITGAVRIEDSSGLDLTSTSGALNVNVTDFPATQSISGSVSVSNFPAPQVVTGTFFQTTQPVSETNVDRNFGTWGYYAGINGSVTVTSGQRVLGIGTHTTTAGSFTINGGSSIPVPAGVSVNIQPLANLVAPTIVFTGTDSYFIEVVS